MTRSNRDLRELLTADARHRIATAEAALDCGEGIPWETAKAELADARRPRTASHDRPQ